MKKQLGYLLQAVWKRRKSGVVAMIVRVPLMVILPLITAYIPKCILSMIDTGRSASYITVAVAILTLGLLVIYLAEKIAFLFLDDMYFRLRLWFSTDIAEKNMHIEYEDQMDAKTKVLRKKAMYATENRAFATLMVNVTLLAASMLGTVSYGT